MLTTSIASCMNAPTTTGMRLNAAATMPIIANPRPTSTACSITFFVRRAMAMARGTEAMSSFMMTTCADSDAAVDVPSVMAIPMSATASTGASFTPSPTIIVTCRVMDSPTTRCTTLSHAGWFWCASSVAFLTAATLPSGKSSDCTSSMPTSPAMMRAEASLSPVSMDSFFTPSRCSFSRDALAFRAARHAAQYVRRACRRSPRMRPFRPVREVRTANSPPASWKRRRAVPVAESPTALSATAPAAVPAATPAPSTCVKPASSAVTYAKRPTRTACPFTSPDTLARLFLDVLHHGIIASMPRQIAFGAQPLAVLIARAYSSCMAFCPAAAMPFDRMCTE